MVDGVRYAVPGDRARLLSGGPTGMGIVELHGRDSVTINSGGEKIFAEEVEAAIRAHPAVDDCVVAVVRIRDGFDASDEELNAEAERHVARYELPKAIVRVDDIVRSPSGKSDHRWATSIAAVEEAQ